MPETRIRTMQVSDLDHVLAWRNEPQVRNMMYTRHEISVEEHHRWFEAASRDDSRYLLIFELDSTACGFINLSRLRNSPVAEWGFYLAPDAPRGTGRKMGVAVLDHAFDELGIHKVCGEAIAFNERSIRYHESLGFVREGVLRQQFFDGMGYHDVHCFGLLRDEWKARHSQRTSKESNDE